MTLTDIARIRAEVESKFGPPRSGPAPDPTLADVAPGWSLYEVAPADSDYQPKGGVVVHVSPLGAWDPETGEAVDRFTLVDVVDGALRWRSLRADQCQRPQEPNALTIFGVCQVATRLLAKQFDRRRGEVDVERVLELYSLGARLIAVLARPAAVAP